MSDLENFVAATVLRNYFHAKDENRPLMLNLAFSPDATLEIKNNSSAISFPSETNGREGIADVLVRGFGQTYENVYTFYLSRPEGKPQRYSCDWLVAMTEKSSRSVRVGSGHYDWSFTTDSPYLANKLVITITEMREFPSSETSAVYSWINSLSYPWSTLEEVTRTMPKNPAIRAVVESLLPRDA